MKKSLLTSVLMSVMLLTSGICKADIVQDIAGDYTGTVTVDLGEGAGDPIPDQKVAIVIEDSYSTIQFTLYNFNFGEVVKNENIVLDGVPVKEEVDHTLTIGNDTYSKDLTLGGGIIQANVKFDSKNSYIDGDKILVTLNITWQGISFKVNFEGTKDAASIGSVKEESGMMYNHSTHMLTTPDSENAGYQVYNAGGAIVASGSFVNGAATLNGLSKGIYIVKSGASVLKFVKR